MTPMPIGPSRLAASLALAVVLLAACGAAQQGAVGPVSTPQLAAPTPSAAPASAAGQGQAPVPPEAPAQPTAPPTPGPTLPRVAPLEPPAFASRVVVPDYDIDLPVISGDLQPPPAFPFCDVAAYVTLFSQPYEEGVTYISAHAQRGMFLPLLDASLRQDGRELIGKRVDLYTNDGMRYEYRVERVIRHATDYSFLSDISLSDRHIVLQTSEGPYGTTEKLQVLGSFVNEEAVDVADATPSAAPRDCRPPELRGSPGP